MTNDIYMKLFIIFYNQSWYLIYIYICRYISIACSGFSDDSDVFDQGDAKARNTMTFAPRALWMSRMWQCKPSWHGRNLSPLRRHLVEIRQSERVQDIFAFLRTCFNHAGRISNMFASNTSHICITSSFPQTTAFCSYCARNLSSFVPPRRTEYPTQNLNSKHNLDKPQCHFEQYT